MSKNITHRRNVAFNAPDFELADKQDKRNGRERHQHQAERDEQRPGGIGDVVVVRLKIGRD